VDQELCAKDKCLDRTCDEWVEAGVSCETLRSKNKCTCNMCQCKAPKTCVIITGIFDGPLTDGPNGVEFYTICDVKDLSSYGFGSANDGKGTDGIEFVFPKTAVKEGTFFYLVNDKYRFKQFFNFDPEYEYP
jgi:hypothetical protein